MRTSTFAGPSERTTSSGYPASRSYPRAETGTIAINSVNAAFNGTIRQALRTAGKIGRALWFDGFNDWVTVTDTTASPLA